MIVLAKSDIAAVANFASMISTEREFRFSL
jgi:hypothetical protein